MTAAEACGCGGQTVRHVRNCLNVPEEEHSVLLQVVGCCLTLSGSSQQRHCESFLTRRAEKLRVTHCRERDV